MARWTCWWCGATENLELVPHWNRHGEQRDVPICRDQSGCLLWQLTPSRAYRSGYRAVRS